MEEVFLQCPHCGEEAMASAKAVGRMVKCPSCGKELNVPSLEPTNPPPLQKCSSGPPPPTRSPRRPLTEVVVTDVKIPFVSLVILLIKVAVAVIPAAILLTILWFVVFSVFVGGCAALLS